MCTEHHGSAVFPTRRQWTACEFILLQAGTAFYPGGLTIDMGEWGLLPALQLLLRLAWREHQRDCIDACAGALKDVQVDNATAACRFEVPQLLFWDMRCARGGCILIYKQPQTLACCDHGLLCSGGAAGSGTGRRRVSVWPALQASWQLHVCRPRGGN